MSLPIVIAGSPPDPIPLKNGTLAGTRWELNVTEVAIIAFAVSSSGNASPLTAVTVNWGDGAVERTEFRPIARLFQYVHQYELPGDYVVTVTATNTDGETSTTYTTPLRIRESRKSVTNPVRRWAGLALPNASIRETLQSVEGNNTAEIVSLGTEAAVGQNFIVVDGREELFLPSAQVTITQPGKLITMARVLSSNLNIIQLDAELNDTYSPVSALVEVRHATTISAMRRSTNNDVAWAFPSTFDATLVKAAVRMLLATRKKERVMLPDFGSDLHRIPFEQNDQIVESLVRRATIEAIQKWEPRAAVELFTMERIENEIQVKLTLVLSNDPQAAFDINFSLSTQA